MKRMECFVAAVLVCVGFFARTVESAEQAPLVSCDGSTLTVTTNAQGAVTLAMVVTPSGSKYKILTDKMLPAALKELIRMNDKPVDLKGELSAVPEDKDMRIKIVGPVKDLSSTYLTGAKVSVTKDKDGKFERLSIQASNGGKEYKVTTNVTTEAVIKDLAALDGKLINIDGEISQSRGQFLKFNSFRPAAAKKPDAKAPDKKKKK